ncbi:General stress protein 14 [Shimia sp. SK013]|uniref:NAD(P)H-dependent oxidoreductase n=1 Tax=Shimia sp. SK013 TaxID=1389006 RepID=UPI0006CCBA4E|nr:NAD(P)H-dependent oxidoreductase [Shimia sp. SK013]KPA21429.1 General stress protein 14 [Shimia sp. SK013]
MAKVIHYYAHPGHRFSHTNKAMWDASQPVEGVTRVDLYAEYPRHNVNIDREQRRLIDHDVVLFQFPVFWYSAPSLLKEWIDLTLEHGFAYGKDGDKLCGKWMMLAVTAAGPQDAYSEGGYQHFPLRTFLTPFEQTARLCKMRFAAPYVFYDALRADPAAHAQGFADLLSGLRDDRIDLDKAEAEGCLYHDSIASVSRRPEGSPAQ